MKTTYKNKILFLATLLFLIACSTKKDNFATRNFQALNTKYNVLYNGGVAFDKGIVDMKTQFNDNFWEILPIERQGEIKPETEGKKSNNANFDLAETKATKAIMRRSIYIDGSERNPQIDEAYLMLGKARYYDQRYIPALEAFNYILYKYPGSDKIYEAKIWREKTNIKLDNDSQAVKNLSIMLKNIKFRNQVFADANAILAQAFLKVEQKDSAVSRLKLATKFTKKNDEKARYRYILGQLYEDLGYKDSAFVSYQSVIDMKRKSPRMYVIQAHSRQAQQHDFEKGDTTVFLKKFNKLLKDRENRPFLDLLNHQMGLFYDKSKNIAVAKKYYNKSLKIKTPDNTYLEASNYRNLAEIYFNAKKFLTAGKYYDSTMVKLNDKSKEFRQIKKKRVSLEDVIKYEGIATRNDSILNLISMSDPEKNKYFENYIVKLKKTDSIQKVLIEKQNLAAAKTKTNDSDRGANAGNPPNFPPNKTGIAPPTIPSVTENTPSNFYFYNSSTVAFGRIEFKKNWGERSLKDNWRTTSLSSKTDNNPDNSVTDSNSDAIKTQEIEQEYTTDYYLKQIPKKQSEIDNLTKDRNFAYYQLGVIYKEKLKENQLAANKFESLLDKNPEERLVLPSMYNLFKIYEILDENKAKSMKDEIIKRFPESRYAQIIGNSKSDIAINETPETAYDKLYKIYESGDYRTAISGLETAVIQYTGEEIVSKFELLKANTIGKIKGLDEYKKALNFVALNYPNSIEGKNTELFLAKEIPAFEALQFNKETPTSWKILYKIGNSNDKNIKPLQDKIAKFITDRQTKKIKSSIDLYTLDTNFVVIHGMKTEDDALGIAEVLKEFKEYKVQETPIIISNDNYKIVQIKKNFEEFLALPKKTNLSEDNQIAPPNKIEQLGTPNPTTDRINNNPKPKKL